MTLYYSFRSPLVSSHNQRRNRIMAIAMFTDTLCLLISFATTLFLLWHVEQGRIISRGLRQPSSDDLLKQTLFKWRQRCILVFLLVLPVQLSRGLLLLFWVRHHLTRAPGPAYFHPSPLAQSTCHGFDVGFVRTG
ncbi:uncharacterized protein EI90DRAFT_3069843 [Cantharellus anzutake]|uniref:uncharacterized protein n=1 Tax=Cantharellus anzutake TaxID=1750568 RepID=UPI001906FE67|nr:uncharacterized protein EI90DRAFT_3069843 [Cantharellus anzutake]KAF8326586.1 hypothetical protein EI90DRAFT_3069843 [Cantharellus anzutake]